MVSTMVVVTVADTVGAGDTFNAGFLASLHEDGFRGMDGEHIDVEVTTADHAVDETERVDLVKIDVEGFEPEVLQGMSRILSRDRPIIVLECNPDGPSTALEEALRPHGYGFYHLQEDQMVQTSGIAPDQQGHCRNFLCVHPDREDWLREL